MDSRNLLITIVGGGLKDDVEFIFGKLSINPVNTVNESMLGNFKTLTYEIPLKEDDIIDKRRLFIQKLTEYSPKTMVLFECGDWMHVYIFKRFRT